MQARITKLQPGQDTPFKKDDGSIWFCVPQGLAKNLGLDMLINMMKNPEEKNRVKLIRIEVLKMERKESVK